MIQDVCGNLKDFRVAGKQKIGWWVMRATKCEWQMDDVLVGLPLYCEGEMWDDGYLEDLLTERGREGVSIVL